MLLFGAKYADRAAELQAAIDANGGAIVLEDRSRGAAAAGADGGAAGAGDAAAPPEPEVIRGAVRGVTTDAAAVVPAADVVIISVNGPAMAAAIEQVAPHLRPEQLVLFLMGIGGIQYRQVADAVARHAPGRGVPIFAATKTLPWACRAAAPGRVNVCGTKHEVGLAVAPDAGALLRAMVPALLANLFPGTKFSLQADAGVLERTCLPYDVLGNDVLVRGRERGGEDECG